VPIIKSAGVLHFVSELKVRSKLQEIATGIGATSSTGSPSPSLLPVLPHAARAVFAFHHPSQGRHCGHWGIRRWLDTDGNVPARGMLSCIVIA
jgi:hypothetical protein